MPPARSLRQRTVTNENDENAAAANTRVTRAKAASQPGSENQVNTAAAKKPLQSKKTTNVASTTTTTSTAAGAQRKRPALGDVSNMTKTENGDGKETKKPTTSRVGLASKATTTQGAGVQKITRNNSSRSALVARDVNKREPTETKRPVSRSGVAGGTQMKRQPSQKSSAQTENDGISDEPPRKKVEIEKVAVEDPVLDEEDIPGELNDAYVAEGVVDLDAEDIYDPLMAAEYVVDIFDYLKELEPTTMPNPDYMSHQDELEWKMRGILVDWLVEVHTRFRLLPETLFLAVNIIDRFLSSEVVSLDRLQLVGVTAMFIASKYEEVLSPHVANFSHVADETFSDKEILDAERHILATLNYDISYPSPMNFLRRISKADNYDVHTRTLAKYLMEISLLDHRLMRYRQSHIAAAAMYLARLVLDRGCWDATLAHYAGYTKEEILPVFHVMVDYLHRPVAHEAFFKKYASKKFMKASIMTRHWAKKYYALYMNGDDRYREETTCSSSVKYSQQQSSH